MNDTRRVLTGFLALILLLAPVQAWALDGVVSCPEGRPLENLQVRVFTTGDVNGSRPAEEATTGGNGRFRLNGSYDDPVILEITGDRGAGRVRVEAPHRSELVTVTYPVVETIILLHDNDMHFDFNSFDEFRERVGTFRKSHPDVFLLNAGDIFTRHPHRWEVDGEPKEDPAWYGERALFMIQRMNEIVYDAMTLGNHELAHIGQYTRQALEQAEFPLLATNVELTTDALPPALSELVLHTSTGRTIAIVGLTTGAAEGVKILKRNDVAAKYAGLPEKHDVVLALNHIGYKADVELAERFPWFDVIIGAHSHTMLKKAELVNGVLVAQAGGNPHQVSQNHPKYLGIITLTLQNGKITGKSGYVETIPLPAAVTVP